MTKTMQAGRITRASSNSLPPTAAGDDHVVLRLAREALRANPPSVRFIARSVARRDQGAPPWPAFD